LDSGTTTVARPVDDLDVPTVEQTLEDARPISISFDEPVAAPPPTPTVGGRIGDYKLEVLLGQGGMGSVYAARHVQFGRQVAIKVLAEELLIDPTAVPRFVREARLASKLESPHAVRVTDIGELPNGVPYMVMELLEGQTLLAMLSDRGGVLPATEAIELIAQACQAAGEAHEVGIVHRDLKLSNLFLTQFAGGHAFLKVLDFGLAKQHRPEEQPTGASLTQAGSFLGTPHYMAPEQMLGVRDIDARTDVWALGVCLYRLVTGVQPFDATSPEKVCMTVLTSIPKPPSQHRAVDPGLEAVILRCLARRPQDRFANAKELGQALRDLLQTQEWSDESEAMQTHTHVLPNHRRESDSSEHDETVEESHDPLERTLRLDSHKPSPPPTPIPPPLRSAPPPPRQSYVSSAAFASYAPPPPPPNRSQFPTVKVKRRRSPLGIAALVVMLVLLALVPIAYVVATHAPARPAVGMMLRS